MKAIPNDGVVRPISVRAICDVDCITHSLKKGQVTTMQSDHARGLVAEGKVEVVAERAVTEAKAEKRG